MEVVIVSWVEDGYAHVHLFDAETDEDSIKEYFAVDYGIGFLEDRDYEIRNETVQIA